MHVFGQWEEAGVPGKSNQNSQIQNVFENSGLSSSISDYLVCSISKDIMTHVVVTFNITLIILLKGVRHIGSRIEHTAM